MPKTISGLAAPLPLANVDTDVIMPKRFLITITREGLADGTFADLRFDEASKPRPDFVLNQPPWTNATILIVGDNFGCGSSREHAVWGMLQMGMANQGQMQLHGIHKVMHKNHIDMIAGTFKCYYIISKCAALRIVYCS